MIDLRLLLGAFVLTLLLCAAAGRGSRSRRARTPRARSAAQWGVGTMLRLEGRIQSRRYIKVSEDGAEERTAFEVSAAEVEELPAEVKV